MVWGALYQSAKDMALDVGLAKLDVPDHLVFRPIDPWVGDLAIGQDLVNGVFTFQGQQVELHGEHWSPVVGDDFLAYLHGFSWLRDLRSVGSESARQQARALISSWARQHSRPDDFAWRVDILGERLANLIVFYEFYQDLSDEDFQSVLFETLVRQGRCLSKNPSPSPDKTGLAQLRGIKGLLYLGVTLPGFDAWRAEALDLLQAEIPRQILGDGGHVTRSPAILMEALQILIDMRMPLISAGLSVPFGLNDAIEKMVHALRFFRHSDKGLTLVHGTILGDDKRCDAIINQAGARSKRLTSLERTGFEKVTQGRTLLMFDCGVAAPAPYDGVAHAAPLSFELSYGRERIFVNCGSHPSDAAWQDALRATAAHNTLSIDHQNTNPVRQVDPVREETRETCLLECSHDGYLTQSGVKHRRRLFLCREGNDLRGEDSLISVVDPMPQSHEIALRFHIHPRVQVSLIQGGASALLRLPSGVGWRFSYSGGALSLEDSVYLAEAGVIRKTKQLVISGDMTQSTAQIKWALQREGL